MTSEGCGARSEIRVMRGIRTPWLLLLLVSGCIPAGAEIGGASGSAPVIGEDMVPDPNYHPRVGDHALLYAIDNGAPLDRLPLLKDVTAYDVFIRSKQERDNQRLFELEEQGWLEWAPPGTRVSVLDIQDRSHTGAFTVTQVRVLEDRQKTHVCWVPAECINRLIHKEPE
jgi:hypothetical protein